MNASNLRRAVSDKSSPRCWRLLKHRTKPWPSSPMPVDRFQHSFKKSVPIDELLRKEKVKLHFHREGMIIGKGASSTDILRWDFSVMGAKSYVLNLSENVRRSLEYKRRNGEWGGKAPLGYLNQRDGNNKSTLIHDPERALLVRMLFEEYAKGCSPISGDLVRMAREWGLRNKTRKGDILSARRASTKPTTWRRPAFSITARISGNSRGSLAAAAPR